MEKWAGGILRGTNAERLAGLPTDVADGYIFIEKDTSKVFIFDTSDDSWNELVTTTGGTLTGATIDVNDNSLVRTGAAQGYTLVHDGTKFASYGRGNALEVLRTTEDGTNIEYAPAPDRGAYNSIIYKVGSVYKAKKGDGTLISSSTTLNGVVQAALDLKGLVVWPAAADGTAYTPTSGLTGWEMSPGTTLLMSQNTRITVPETFSGTVFKINDAYGGAHKAFGMMIVGGMFQQAGVAPDAQWTFLHMQSSSSTANSAGVYQNTIRDVYVKRCLNFIKLTCNTGTQSWVNGNQFDNIWCDYPHEGIVFEQASVVGASTQAINRNNFNNVVIQADQGEITGPYAMLHGIQDISGVNNVFHNCHMWDVEAPNFACNITNKAENTIIIGGIMVHQPYDWEMSANLGLRTVVIGAEKSGGSGTGSNTGLINPFVRKTGTFMGGGGISNTAVGDGLLNGLTSAGGTISNSFTTSGLSKRGATGATINTLAGIRSGTIVTMRYFNPFLHARLKLNQITAQRIYVGYCSGLTPTIATADDPLENLSGYGLYHSTTHGTSGTNWLVARNTGGASSTISTTGIAGNTTAVQNLFVAGWEDTTPKFQWRLNSIAGQIGEHTTTIPAQTTGLVVGIWISNTAAADKTVDCIAMYLKNGKAED